MKQQFAAKLGALVLTFSILSAAGTLKGTISNGTTGERAAAKQVAVLSLTGDMQQIGNTITDSGGNFHVDLAEAKGAMLVRVAHQGVTYYRMVDEASSDVELMFYEASKAAPEEIAVSMDVQRYQTQGNTLAVSELIVLQNASRPPRTLLNDRSFEIYLPEDAIILRAGLQVGNGPPLPASPMPGGEKGRYYFSFPVRPGETRVQIDYRLPYDGKKSITAKAALPVDYFYVALPTLMKFEADLASDFKRRMDNADVDVQMTRQLKPGRPVFFRVSGTGALPNRQSVPQQQAAAPSAERPGGGLGAPIDTPDPIHGIRWQLLAALCLALAAGGVYVTRSAAILGVRTGETAKRVPLDSIARPLDPSHRKNRATLASRGDCPSGSSVNKKRSATRSKGKSPARVKIHTKCG